MLVASAAITDVSVSVFQTELDPDVSVTPLPNTPSVEMEQSPVAVYF